MSPSGEEPEEALHEVGLEGRPTSEVRRRAERVLGRVALLARRRHRPHELSGGEMQRVAVARALPSARSHSLVTS